MSLNNTAPVPAPNTFDEVPQRLLEAYEYIGLDTGQMQVVLPVIFNECQHMYNGDQLRSIHKLIEYREFLKWNYEAILRVPDVRFQSWVPSINNILTEIHPGSAYCGKEDSHIVIYTLLLYFLSPLFSLSDLIRLKGGWHILQEGRTYFDVNINKFLPRSQEEREELLALFEEVEEPYIRRYIVRFLGITPIDPNKQFWQRNAPGGDRGDSWGGEAQSAIYSRYPDLFDAREGYEATRIGLIKPMINCISDKKQLAAMIMGDNHVLTDCAIERWGEAIRQNGLKRDWSSVHELVRKKPELFKFARPTDLFIIEALWNTGEDRLRDRAIDQIFDYIYLSTEPFDDAHSQKLQALNNDVKAGLKLLSKMVDSDKDDFMRLVSFYQINSPQLPYLVYTHRLDSLYDLMWGVVLGNGGNLDEYPDITQEILDLMFVNSPEKLSDIAPKELGSLLPFCSSETLNKTSHLIIPVVTKYTMATDGLMNFVAKIELRNLEKMNWLFDRDENLRSILLRGLMKRDEPEAVNIIKEYCKASGTSLVVLDQCLDYLEALGESLEDVDPYYNMSNEEILGVAKNKKIDKRKLPLKWNEELASSLDSLDEHAAIWMLGLAVKTKDVVLPRTARRLFSLLSDSDKLTFVKMLLVRWCEDIKDHKLDWILLFVSHLTDESIIDELSEMLERFGKKKPQKANLILCSLYHIGTREALILLHDASKSSYHKNVKSAATEKLKLVAKDRGITVYELGEELVSDYGIEQGGWCITLSDGKYRIIIENDLTLRVIGANGRITKSFPKPKNDVEPLVLECAQTKFKFLKSKIASEVKQLRLKLIKDLAADNQWCSGRWKEIYLHHPFISKLVQGVIWSRLNIDGDFIGSFRICENGLIDSLGDVIDLEKDEMIRVCHLCDEDLASRALWHKNIEESDKSPLFDQLGLPIVELSEKECASLVSYRYQGYKLEISKFRMLVNQFGMRPQGGDKGYESDFYFFLPEKLFAFNLKVTTISTCYELTDTVFICYTEITEANCFCDLVSMEDISPITLTMFHSMMKQISDASEGYQEGWTETMGFMS